VLRARATAGLYAPTTPLTKAPGDQPVSKVVRCGRRQNASLGLGLGRDPQARRSRREGRTPGGAMGGIDRRFLSLVAIRRVFSCMCILRRPWRRVPSQPTVGWRCREPVLILTRATVRPRFSDAKHHKIKWLLVEIRGEPQAALIFARPERRCSDGPHGSTPAVSAIIGQCRSAVWRHNFEYHEYSSEKTQAQRFHLAVNSEEYYRTK
jgi:hypothetical protein